MSLSDAGLTIWAIGSVNQKRDPGRGRPIRYRSAHHSNPAGLGKAPVGLGSNPLVVAWWPVWFSGRC